MGVLKSHKGVLIAVGMFTATAVLGAVVIVAVRSETIRLVDRARHIDVTVADRVRMVRGVGGVGRYMVILPGDDGRPLQVTQCPLPISNAICVVMQ